MAKRLGLLLLIAAAASCGGTSTPSTTPASTGATTPDTVAGTITGFGSVVIDGVEYDDSAPAVVKDVDPANPTPATLGDLKLGQQVEASFANGKMAQASVRSTVIGTIDRGSINPNDAGSTNTVADSFTVLGQTVVFVPSGAGVTVFAGVTDSSGLADGQIVEVHGTLDAQGHILATRIEVIPAGGTTVSRVFGVVGNANASASTFTLGALTVDYHAATIVPSGATIADGDRVFVFSDQLPTGTAPNLTLVAKSIRVAGMAAASRPFRVGGLITAVTPASGQALPNFMVDGFSVDASKAALAGNATAADITVNALVRVDGTLANGTLTAARIAVTPVSSGREVLLIGQVSSFASASSFVVRGTTVDASKATFLNGDASQLADGAFVAIQGHLGATAVIADRVRFMTPPKDVPFHLMGVVSGYSASSPAPQPFSILGIAAQLDPAATFTGGVVADFKDGALVEVTGTFTGTAFDVTRVRFIPGAPTPVANLTGTISGLTSTNGVPTSFMLNNATITVTAATSIRNGPLADGQVVEVRATVDTATGSVVAQSVEVLSRSTVHLVGTISSFTSASSFTVDGQSVDASGATFLPASASASDLAAGKLVRVDGSPSNGVVKASTVQFLR